MCIRDRVLGDGIAVEPESSVLVAPADGTVSVVMEGSLHALSLIHIYTLKMKVYAATKKGWKSGNSFTITPTVTVSLTTDASTP